MGQKSKAQHTQAYALAGEIVRDSKHAKRILIDAIRTGRDWIEPQARNGMIKLRRAEAAQ